MNWNNCQYFMNQNQCKNKREKNGVCKEHCHKQFIGEYIFTCISGEGYIYPIKSNNDMDIISYEQIWTKKKKRKYLNLEIPRELLFSFYENKKMYNFNILSLVSDINIILKQKFIDISIKNPITKKELNTYDKIRLKLKLEYLYDFNHPDILNEIKEKNDPFSSLLNILVKFENSGYFFDPEWFKNLTNLNISKIIHETKLIWNYYNENISFIIDEEIVDISNLTEFYNKLFDINEVDLLNKALIILGGLTYVIPEVRSLYPDLLHE